MEKKCAVDEQSAYTGLLHVTNADVACQLELCHTASGHTKTLV